MSSSTVTQELMMLNQWICRAHNLVSSHSAVQAAHCKASEGSVHHAFTLVTHDRAAHAGVTTA